MAIYRRILALADISANGEAVARRAAQMALAHNATLAVAALVDYTPGFECDHIPFRTPQEMREAIARDVAGKLDDMVARIGLGGAEVIVAGGDAEKAGADLVRSWRPDLVLVGSHAPHGLDAPPRSLVRRDGRLPFDVLIVQMGKPSFTGRLIQALSAAI